MFVYCCFILSEVCLYGSSNLNLHLGALKYPSAQIGDRTRFSDDGEPGGTAGRPMFSAISSSGLDHVMVVVIR